MEYATPASEWVQRVETTRGGVLEELRILSGCLARAYGWQPAQATGFILTDVTPRLPGIRVECNGRLAPFDGPRLLRLRSASTKSPRR